MAYKNTDEILKKIKDDEPIFILRGQDKSSPKQIMDWIKDNFELVSEAKLKEAFYIALDMRRYDHRKDAD